MDRQSIEDSLFTWKTAAEAGPFSIEFAEVELVSVVGQFPVGSKFPAAYLDGARSLLVLQDEQQEFHAFNLTLQVGEAADISDLTSGACPVDIDLEEDSHFHEGHDCGCGHDHTPPVQG